MPIRRAAPTAPALPLPERLAAALAALRAQARPGELAGMARFGLNPTKRLGVAVPQLRRLARELGRDHELAAALWATAIPDAQILATCIAEPARFTAEQMDAWTRDLTSWDVCDQACSNAFARRPDLAWARVPVWAAQDADGAEFVRRAAFALLAALAVHDKGAPDERFLAALPLIEAVAGDERNFVKKAVNWALRQIGKRNARLLGPAIVCAERLREQPSRSARWIAADALRELRARRDRAKDA
ncbi:MAG TPA: DNA alkylation repair protein [Burkholderiaceae bacterium]|nr:DNA alkylation repair protein [Burkholderiaceae bacterium]HMZ02321.1 DNA alkylation repair protein [Burkholderiaceae bacterium]HNB45405.1 DNA alkylation repair protein [Burkholderiaceae bacterium]HNG78085.1 DNA alkylation repair protein [Burkholderiaceae bacterium]